MNTKKSVLVTGAAGFIGFHLSQRLINEGYNVIGVDSLNDYYDVELKKARLSQLSNCDSFTFCHLNIADSQKVKEVFEKNKVHYVVNLAAQAGVRYSLENPQAYVESNLTGFVNILEACRHHEVEHLLFASSSSVYGANTVMPFSVNHNVDHPISLYAASKKANELMAHTYASNFGLPVSGLRFFTVYGPWGRPDMALFLFTKAILEDKPIDVFNNGKMRRDFTYVDDIVEGIFGLLTKPASSNVDWDSANPDPASSFAPYGIYNIGSHSPVELMEFIRIIEKNLGKKANINYLPMQTGDVAATYADVSNLTKLTGYKPSTSIETGIENFISWYRSYYNK